MTINNKYNEYYMMAQILPALLYSLTMAVLLFNGRTSTEMVLCIILASAGALVQTMFLYATLVFNILTIICYTFFIYFVGKIQMSSVDAKNVYRSLIISSLTVIFGWMATILINPIASILKLDVDSIYVKLLAGLFVNSASATHFFVYYTMSKEYRRLFDQYLLIDRIKKKIGISNCTVFPNKPIFLVTEQI
ncbi:hypothetical protein DICVIV_10013 [Dictyocaulus viviparus]|uniref:G-protein coupled receptors family 1 profile domain-containing protein n=1 Tax=Dictyocaulus viviparus TaxID=29172 RepID=A0A0D8XJN5_DICVI|nr:hypothetical protein DICVIV_10013 [Dictyocaulus viviparus]